MSERAAPQAGEFVGPYRLIKPLGQGSTGAVWVAEDITLRRHVAIKLLDPGHAENPEMQKRFGREARLLSLFNHEGLPSVFAFGEEDGIYYFTMTHLEGTNGETLLGESQPLSFSQVGVILEKILSILAALHQRKIVHRDIKPEHLLLGHGRVWLIDFGCAKPMADGDPGMLDALGVAGEGLTVYGRVLGTHGYIAPEVEFGEGATESADLFALGVCAIDWLLARRWIALDTPEVRSKKIHHGPGQVLRRLGLSPGQVRFLERLAHPDPDKRPKSALEAKEELEFLLRPKVSLPEPQSTPHHSRAPKRLSLASGTLFGLLGLSAALLMIAYQLPTGLSHSAGKGKRTVYLSVPGDLQAGDRVIFEGALERVMVSPHGWEFRGGGREFLLHKPELVLQEGQRVLLKGKVLRINGSVLELDGDSTTVK